MMVDNQLVFNRVKAELTFLFKQSGKNKSDFSKDLGISRQNLNNYLKTGKVSLDKLIELENAIPNFMKNIFRFENEIPKKLERIETNLTNPTPFYDIDINTTSLPPTQRQASHVNIPQVPKVDAYIPIRTPMMPPHINAGDIIGIQKLHDEHIIDPSSRIKSNQILIKGQYHIDGLGEWNRINYRGMKGSPLLKAWHFLNDFAKSLPHTKIEYSRN